jgi:hypothetical protein
MKQVIWLWTMLFLLLSSSCQKEVRKLNLTDESEMENRAIAVVMDSLTFSGGFYSSCIGQMRMKGDKLLFADQMFCEVFAFDTTGNFEGKFVGKGAGPNEIGDVFYFTPMPNGYYFLGSSYDAYYLDKNWQGQFKNRVDFGIQKSQLQLRYNPQPEDRGIYEVGYFTHEVVSWDSTHVVIPVNVSHPKINAYFSHTDEFYSQCAVWGMLDVTTGKVDTLFGRRPNVYIEKRNLPNLRFAHYDKVGEELWVTFEADPKIYRYHLENGFIAKFGYEGREMNTDYRLYTNFEEAERNYFRDREEFGYYTQLEYIAETGMLFRTYQKGKNASTTGLQVYEGHTLIADLDVPKHFKLLGYAEPYYYAQGYIDEVNETMQVFRFTLQESDA